MLTLIQDAHAVKAVLYAIKVVSTVLRTILFYGKKKIKFTTTLP